MISDRDLLRHLTEGGAELYDRQAPPALDLHAITGGPASKPERAARRRWQLPPAIVAVGAAACMAIGIFAGATWFAEPPQQLASPAPQTSTPVSGRQVSLDRFTDAVPAGAAAQANVFKASEGRTVELTVRGLEQPKNGQFYELWVLGEGTKMISLGIVRVDKSGSATIELPLPVSLRRFPIFDISLERGDGNPAHSGDSIMRSAPVA